MARRAANRAAALPPDEEEEEEDDDDDLAAAVGDARSIAAAAVEPFGGGFARTRDAGTKYSTSPSSNATSNSSATFFAGAHCNCRIATLRRR